MKEWAPEHMFWRLGYYADISKFLMDYFYFFALYLVELTFYNDYIKLILYN